MENRTLFLAFLATWIVYILAAHVWARKKRLPIAGITVSHIAPTVVAVVMAYVFLIARWATVAQFVAGSESGMDLWSLWFNLWPILLIVTMLSGVISLVWSIVACVKKPLRRWLPVAIASVVMSGFGLFTVGANFPDA